MLNVGNASNAKVFIPASGSNGTLYDLLHVVIQYSIEYYTPLITIIGSLGNVLSIFIFFKTKLRKLSSSYYLAALGISDTVFLTLIFVQWLNVYDIQLYQREFLCQIFTFLSGMTGALSVWFVVAFTVERFIAVLYPLKRQTMCTVRRAKSILFGLAVIGILHSLPLFVLFAPQTSSGQCDVIKDYEVIKQMTLASTPCTKIYLKVVISSTSATSAVQSNR